MAKRPAKKSDKNFEANKNALRGNDRTKGPDRAPSGLSWQQEHFCVEYTNTMNASEAARRASYSEKTAGIQGHYLLKQPKIQARITEIFRNSQKKLNITPSEIIERYTQIALGDVNDLTSVELGACRYCYGTDHEFQWKTQREWREEAEKDALALTDGDPNKAKRLMDKAKKGEEIPGIASRVGGFGYDATSSPNPDCPECHGHGIERVVVRDTRAVLAHPLYEGVKQTKEGIEIKIADRSKALESLARNAQLFKDAVEFSASHDLIKAAKAISDAAPAVDSRYMAQNADRLGDDEAD